jgi:hypothetical protein
MVEDYPRQNVREIFQLSITTRRFSRGTGHRADQDDRPPRGCRGRPMLGAISESVLPFAIPSRANGIDFGSHASIFAPGTFSPGCGDDESSL